MVYIFKGHVFLLGKSDHRAISSQELACHHPPDPHTLLLTPEMNGELSGQLNG